MLAEYRCPKHGVFEDINKGDKHKNCPECDFPSPKIFSTFSFRVSHRENLPLGSKSRGRFIPPTKDNSGILIPSYGLLEKEEVDYIAEYELDKEKNTRRESQTKKNIEYLTKLANKTQRGHRAEVIKEVIGGKQ